MSKVGTKQNLRNTILNLVTVGFLVAVLAGCVQVRLFTYPGEFVWLEDEYVKGTMQEMATRMRNLQRLTEYSVQNISDSNRNLTHQEIINELELLEEFAISISPKTSGISVSEFSELPATNHLLIDRHIDDFISEIMRARTLAELAPSNYSGIGQLVGNCNACHRQR